MSRHGDRHDLNLTVSIRFEGEYDQLYTDGDNREVLPTDTMKNMVYALAASNSVGEPEVSGRVLAEHFLERNPRLRRVRIDLTEQAWGRIAVGAREHGQAFVRQSAEARSATVQGQGDRITIGAGVRDLVILKSSRSGFAGFLRTRTDPAGCRRSHSCDRAHGNLALPDVDLDFNLTWRAVRNTLLEAFGEHDSRSVQHTLHAMGRAVVDNVDAVTAIRLVMPNKHHLPVDLTPLGLQNRNEIFVPTDEPYGLIEATVMR